MSDPNNKGSVTKASLTVIVDNKADLIVESSDRVKYFTEAPLLAEHGYSVLIRLDESEKTILWDAGVSRVALMENIRRMELDVSCVAKVALSHGHSDHYAALTDLLKEMELLPAEREWDTAVTAEDIEAWKAQSRLPIIAHPAAFRERWWVKDDGKMVGPFPQPSEKVWQALGATMVCSDDPCRLAPGCWTTGYVPRISFEKAGRPKKLRYREGSEYLHDDLDDDQAIVIHVDGKGLIVLTGCAHAGIVNTIMRARALFKTDTVYALIGGFHLARANDDEIEQTLEYVREANPSLIIPGHCTGLRAISRFAQEMPDAFVESVVGATYLL